MITGTITKSDHLYAMRFHGARWTRWCHIACGVAIVIGLLLYVSNALDLGLVIASAAGAGAVSQYLVAILYIPWQVSRAHKQRKEFNTPLTYSWDANSLEVQSAAGTWKREWTNYIKYKEDDRLFLLYLSDNLFEMVPKSWFRDQEQIAEFRELAVHVGKKQSSDL